MENINAALQLAMLGLTTTFVALLALRFIIGALARLSARPVGRGHTAKEQSDARVCTDTQSDAADEDVAAIMAVLGAMGATPEPGGRIRIEKR